MARKDPIPDGLFRVLNPQSRTAGTAFLTHDGLVVTCAHVVEKAGSGPGKPIDLIRLVSGAQLRGTVRDDAWSPGNAADVAIIKLAEPPATGLLPLGSSAGAEGGTFRTRGFPGLKSVESMPGECQVLTGDPSSENRWPAFVLRSQEITYGFSGAPVWDDELGTVIGMVMSIALAEQDAGRRFGQTAFMIPVETIRKVCPAFTLTLDKPYRDLAFFEAEDKRFYFGREAAIREVVTGLAERGVVILVGTSGSGKSSLVRAGLAKALDPPRRVVGLTGPRHIVVPGAVPLNDLRQKIPDDPGTADRGLILIVDQFERIYTQSRDEQAHDRFIDALLAHADSGVILLIALRADLYGRAMRHVGLSKIIKEAQVTLLPMEDDELREAIKQPAHLLKRSFQPGLVETLIADVHGEAGALPLLELTLTDLWDREAHQGVLTAKSYKDLVYENPDGTQLRGVAGAVARRAQAVWQDLTPPEQAMVPTLFIRMVAKEAEVEGGRLAARTAWAEEWNDQARAVLERFIEARLLVTRTDPVSSHATVEIAHEALLRAWPELRKWLNQHGEFARWYGHEFAPDFQRWLQREEHDDFLLPQSVLPAAQRWLLEYPDGLAGRAEEYVRRSEDHWAREQARERERAERLQKALQDEESQRLIAQRRAEEARSLMWATRADQSDDQALALALALESCAIEQPPAPAQRTLADLAYRPGPRRYLRFGHAGNVWAVAQAGDLAVSGAGDGELIIWELVSGASRRTLRGHTGAVRAVAMSADGHRVASGSEDRTVVVWDADTGRVRARLAEHADTVHAIAMTPDGRRVVSGSADGSVIVWEPVSETFQHLTGHTDVVTGVGVNAGGTTAVSCSADGSLRVWDLETSVSRRLTGHPGCLWCVALSCDARTAVSGSSDRSVAVWDLQTGQCQVLPGHTGNVWTVALSSEARTAVSGSSDRTVIVWDVDRKRAVRRIGTPETINAIAMDAPGSAVICAGDNQRLTRWDTGTGTRLADLTGHSAAITAAALSRDGGVAVSGSANGELLTWQSRTGDVQRRIETDDGPVDQIALSDDGRTALTVSAKRVVGLWDTTTGRARRLSEGSEIVHAALSGDGRVCAASTPDGVYVWGPENLRLREAAQRVALSTDGGRILFGFPDGRLSWRDLGHRGRRDNPLPSQHQGGVRDLALSGDGSVALSLGADGETVLWDLTADGAQLARLTDKPVRAAALSADLRIVSLLAEDDSLYTWDLRTGTLTQLADKVRVMALGSAGTATLSSDGQHGLILWDAARADLDGFLSPYPGHEITGLALSRDGRMVLCGARGAGQSLLHLATGDPVITWQDDRHLVNDLALSADASCAVGALDYLSLFVWSTPDGRLLRTLAGHTEAVTSAALSADGRVGVSGSVDQKIILWDVAAGEFLGRLVGHTAAVLAVAMSADGRIAVSGAQDATAIVWDVRTGDRLHRYTAHQAPVIAAAVSSDGSWAAAASADGTVSLCEMASGTWHVLTGQGGRPQTVAFTPCERLLAAGMTDGAIVLWDLATRQPIRRLEAHDAAVTRLACGADDNGMIAVAGHADGSVLCWRIHSPERLVSWTRTNRHVREFTCAEREAFLIEPQCDQFGNPPPRRALDITHELTAADLGPAPASKRPRPAELTLALGQSRFDAIQRGRPREWRLDAPPNARITAEIIAGGIDLDPMISLYAPGGAAPLAVGQAHAEQRCRLGPVALTGPGPYTIVASGNGDSSGGYTLSLQETR